MPIDGKRQLRVSVSMVTYNSSFELLRQTLDCLHRALVYARDQGQPVTLQLLLVDNSIDPNYRAKVRKLIYSDAQLKFDAVDFWHPGANVGYGAAHNQALEKVDSELHLVLNPDVEMAEDALAVGLAYMQTHPDVAMVSPSATNATGEVQYLCKRYPSVLVLLLRAFGPDFLRDWFRRYLFSYEMRGNCGEDGTADVPLVSGCCMYARTESLRQVSGFSPRYFLYFEDFDLSLRLHNVGRLVYVPDMHIVHHGGYSAQKGLDHIGMFVTSGFKFFRRHGWCWI